MKNYKHTKAEMLSNAAVVYIHCPKCQHEEQEINNFDKIEQIQSRGISIICASCGTKYNVKGFYRLPAGREVTHKLSAFEFKELIKNKTFDLRQCCNLDIDNACGIEMFQDGISATLQEVSLTFQEAPASSKWED